MSLDQVQRLREMQESPRNSPADRTDFNQANKTRLPVIHKCSEKSSQQFQTTSGNNHKGYATTNSLDVEPPADMDFRGICFDEDMPEIGEEVTSETEEYFRSLDSTSVSSDEKYEEYFNCPSIPPPDCDSKLLYEDASEGNLDQCAPFIPPPLSDTQFSVDEKELEMFNLNNPFGCDELAWKNDMWEVSNDFDKETFPPQKGFIKRNLSTPTFFPLVGKVNPEP